MLSRISRLLSSGSQRGVTKRRTVTLALVLVALVAALLVLSFGNDYALHIGTIALYYAVLASSWALLAGYTGQVSFAHMAFAGIGGYTSGLLISYAGAPLTLSIPAGILAAALVGGGIGWLCLRLSGPYLALFTLAFSEIFRIILVAEYRVTRGSQGLHITELFPGASRQTYYLLGLILLLITVGTMYMLLRSRVGLFWRAVRENEGAAAAGGVNVARYRILAFVISSALAALAGTFYAHYMGILTPNIASVPEMGLVISMTVIGGLESLPGAVLGAVFVYSSSELLREYGQWRFVLFGLVLLLTLRLSPRGLIAPLLSWLTKRATGSVQAATALGRGGGEDRGLARGGDAPRSAKGAAIEEQAASPASSPGWRAERPSHSLLEVERLTKRFGGIVAVSDVSLRIDRGELVGLIGPNGSGKTTLINMLTGALRPDGGTVRFDGEIMNGRRPHEFAHRGIGRTFQISQLFRRMTVLENLLVPPLSRAKHSWESASEHATAQLAQLQLAHLANEEARVLSGGQQKLLELGRATMLNARLLLLDEPFAGVHPRLLQRVVAHIRELNELGYTIVVVDHNLDVISTTVNRLVVMAQGQVIASGAPVEVLKERRVIEAYTGTELDT
jgi:branched-chain amino acid transport system permease protein